jgi:hypothetical protein
LPPGITDHAVDQETLMRFDEQRCQRTLHKWKECAGRGHGLEWKMAARTTIPCQTSAVPPTSSNGFRP